MSSRRKATTTTISIHAPPRGATLLRLGMNGDEFKFQFTPLREGRHDKPFWGVCEAISIHAPPRGAT